MPQIFWAGQSGCLLPMLIILNLFLGRIIFNSIHLWLGVEAGLILLFIIKIRILMRKINRQFGQDGHGFASGSKSHGQNGRGWASDSRSHRPYGRVIDVEGKVVEEQEKLK